MLHAKALDIMESTSFLLPKWLSSFYKAIFPMVNDIWVSKLRKADVPCVHGWILNDSTGVVDVIKKT